MTQNRSKPDEDSMKFTRTVTITKVERKIVLAGAVVRPAEPSPGASEGDAAPPITTDQADEAAGRLDAFYDAHIDAGVTGEGSAGQRSRLDGDNTEPGRKGVNK
jgi:hypothetical protein